MLPAKVVLAAWLLLPAAAGAQSAPTLLDSYGRAIALLNFMTSYVSVSLLTCAEKRFLTEAEAEARFKAYRGRNAALLERAETWRQQAENRLRAQGEERAAQERADEAGMSGTTMALARIHEEDGKVRDHRALCAGKAEGIESGRYDLSRNAEFSGLMGTTP